MNYRNLKGNKIWVTGALRPRPQTPAETEGSGSPWGPAGSRPGGHPARTQKGTVQKLTCCFPLARGPSRTPAPAPAAAAGSVSRSDHPRRERRRADFPGALKGTGRSPEASAFRSKAP